MKKLNLKGSALIQVLVLSAIIATIVVVLLKFSITRTSNMVQTKHIVGSKLAVQGCISILNEEELKRVQAGKVSYFEENETFHCSYGNYNIDITRGDYTNNNAYDHSTGIVRPLNFKVSLYNTITQYEPD